MESRESYVVDDAVRVLEQAIGMVCIRLDGATALATRGVFARTLSATSSLRNVLVGSQTSLDPPPAPPIQTTIDFRALDEVHGAQLLKAADEFVRRLDREVLLPARNTMSPKDFQRVQYAVGQVWGWLFCDVQDPLHQGRALWSS
jgi:hypothetical protein